MTSASDGSRGRPPAEGSLRDGASVRSAARSLAERARGLAAISASSGTTGRLVSTRKVGGGLRDLGQMARDAAAAAALGEKRLDDAVLERMERHDHQPAAGLEHALGRGRAGGELAQLVVDEDAQRLERAGRRMDVAWSRACTTPATISASARVVRIGASWRAATMARATAREWRSSPKVA